MNPYKTLGIRKNASKKTIKKAYYAKSQETHPDKEGGSAGKFRIIKEAYDILDDPEKRAYYDKHGKTMDDEKATSISGTIVTLFLKVIESVNCVDTQNIVNIMNDSLDTKKKEIEKGISKLEKIIVKFEKIDKRISGSTRFFNNVTENQVGGIKQTISDYQKQLEMIDACIAFLTDYEYDAEVNNAMMMNAGMYTFFTG